MTEKRYVNGKLAKWYYNRSVPSTITDGENSYCLVKKQEFEDITGEKILGSNDLIDYLNQLSDENEQLKDKNCRLTYELSKEIINLNNLQGEYSVLEIENEELKQELEELNIPIDEIKDTVSDARGRTVGVYYND